MKTENAGTGKPAPAQEGENEMQMYEIHAEHKSIGRFIMWEAGNTEEEAKRDALKAAAKELFTRPRYIHIISINAAK